jgi:LysR family transcriptional activator of dmlA
MLVWRDGAVLHEWALSGEGISWEALWDISDDLASGRLVHLMPDYQSSPMELYAIFAPIPGPGSRPARS